MKKPAARRARCCLALRQQRPSRAAVAVRAAAAASKLFYPRPLLATVEINFASQPVAYPLKATGMPSVVTFGDDTVLMPLERADAAVAHARGRDVPHMSQAWWQSPLRCAWSDGSAGDYAYRDGPVVTIPASDRA